MWNKEVHGREGRTLPIGRVDHVINEVEHALVQDRRVKDVVDEMEWAVVSINQAFGVITRQHRCRLNDGDEWQRRRRPPEGGNAEGCGVKDLPAYDNMGVKRWEKA